MQLKWETPVQYVRKVGPKRAESLAKEGVRTAGDLALVPPFRYEDRARFRQIARMVEGEFVSVLGRIIAAAPRITRQARIKIFEMVVRDDSGAVNVVFFNQPYLSKVIREGQTIILFGRAERDDYSPTHRFQFRNPEFELVEEDADARIHTGRIVPIYRKLGVVTGKQLRVIQYHLLQGLAAAPEVLPEELCRRRGFTPRLQALREVHFPEAPMDEGLGREAALQRLNEGDSPAHRQLVFEEFFSLQSGLQFIAQSHGRLRKPHRIEVNDRIRDVVKRTLPFKPTGAQKRVIREIVDDMTSPWPMNRLLQGDVGSGKTIVAVQAIIVAVENGGQAAIMAPTEILAEQHFATFSRLLEHTGYGIALLKSSLPAAERNDARDRIAAGEIQVVVGTHSVIQKEIAFRNLVLAVIDEQHRFGVMQRAELMEKGRMPDILVMTATPIPRTLALTVYGDLSLSVIDEMPPGRKPVQTKLFMGERQIKSAYRIIAGELERGHQAYVVYPLIEESEKVDLRHAQQGFEELSGKVFPGVPIGLLHGRMADDEKKAVMDAFRRGAVHILVSTTVIEVGIDVPAATVMLVQHAERFGLSQLHQLRGRVGRGGDQAWCLLAAYDVKTDDARRRLEVMVKTTDGFQVAEEDLLIRGPGEFTGTRQSGRLNFRFGSLIRHHTVMEDARLEAERLVKAALAAPEGPEMQYLHRMKPYWDERFGLILVG